jgi:hypothetical protein
MWGGLDPAIENQTTLMLVDDNSRAIRPFEETEIQMKTHELKAQYQARATELLSIALSWPKRSEAASDLIAAEQQLRKSTLSAMDTALRIYSDLIELVQRDFPEADYSPSEYVAEQSLNILQKCIEMCMPNTTRARPIAYVLYQAHIEGYTEDSIDDFVDEFFGGLEDAIKTAEREIGGNPYFRYYSSEDEFPSTIPQR